MLTGKECLEFTGLTLDEVDAIAEHEGITAIVAAEEGSCLLKTHRGVETIRRYIREDIAHAKSHRNEAHASELKAVLDHFNQCHH